MALGRPIACLPRRLIVLILFTFAHAQQIATSTPVPPLQWLNITAFLQGPAPPPLMDASLGYDPGTRTLLVFGGESQGGFAQSSTYLLNLDTLTWSIPTPPATLLTTPPPRSAAIAGTDFAASNRHGHIIIGGKGPGGLALADVWEYDYINQFWRQVTVSSPSPSPRWSASGGIDIRTTPVQDPLVPGPNNTFFLAGGQSDTSHANSLSDVWQLNVAGTLSSNLPDAVQATWVRLPINNALPSRFRQGGTVIGQKIVSVGGCSVPPDTNTTCAEQDSYVLNTQTGSSIEPGACPAPRVGAAVVPNYSGLSTPTTTQAFLILGTIPESMWQDDGGLQNGEVAVLDIDTGSWARVLPSGDPGSKAQPSFPTPRQGAAGYSSPSGLVGLSRSDFSDTIVFGGRDASGTYLSEVWILRAYNATLTQSNQKWRGFGDGTLQTGVNANGAGVTVQFMTKCASRIGSLSPPGSGSLQNHHIFDNSVSHKALAPLSVALLLLTAILYRLSPSAPAPKLSKRDSIPVIASVVVAVAAYATGVAGLASSFTGIILNSQQKPSNINLQTLHGQLGLGLFVAVYGLLPFLLFLSTWGDQLHRMRSEAPTGDVLGAEKKEVNRNSAPSMCSSTPTSLSPFARSNWWAPPTPWRKRSTQVGTSNIAGPIAPVEPPSAPQRKFEVLNRPARGRRISGNNLSASPLANSSRGRVMQSIGDIDWLERRRALNEVGDVDYAVTQANKARAAASAETQKESGNSTTPRPSLPGPFSLVSRLTFHLLVLVLCIFTLVELWARAPRFTFVIFLLWTIAFYVAVIALAWRGRPNVSILAAILARFRPIPHSSQCPSTSTELTEDSLGPYVHHKPRAFRAAGRDDGALTPGSVENQDEDDEDEDATQQRIEDEMRRREVSIVTVPRRKLWITNPS